MAIDERVRRFIITDQKLSHFTRPKLLLLCFSYRQLSERLFTNAPKSNTAKLSFLETFRHRATTQRERTEQEVHRRADHLSEIASSGNFLAQVSKRAKRVNEFLSRRRSEEHTSELQ